MMTMMTVTVMAFRFELRCPILLTLQPCLTPALALGSPIPALIILGCHSLPASGWGLWEGKTQGSLLCSVSIKLPKYICDHRNQTDHRKYFVHGQFYIKNNNEREHLVGPPLPGPAPSVSLNSHRGPRSLFITPISRQEN